jgi:hypothetical protein
MVGKFLKGMWETIFDWTTRLFIICLK